MNNGSPLAQQGSLPARSDNDHHDETLPISALRSKHVVTSNTQKQKGPSPEKHRNLCPITSLDVGGGFHESKDICKLNEVTHRPGHRVFSIPRKPLLSSSLVLQSVQSRGEVKMEQNVEQGVHRRTSDKEHDLTETASSLRKRNCRDI